MDQAPYTPPATPSPTEPTQKNSAGPIIGTIIVIVLLALGALYFWGAQLNQQAPDDLPYIPGDESSMTDSRMAAPDWIPPSSNSDEAAAIEADLQATDMNAFEQQTNADLEAANSEL